MGLVHGMNSSTPQIAGLSSRPGNPQVDQNHATMATMAVIAAKAMESNAPSGDYRFEERGLL